MSRTAMAIERSAEIVESLQGQRFHFIQGEIGVHNLLPVVTRLGRMDVVYCAPPPPKEMAYWHNDIRTPYTYFEFFAEMKKIWRAADADEYYIEAGSNAESVARFFTEWGVFREIRTVPILYSAPMDGTSARMAKSVKPYSLIAVSRRPLTLPPAFTYSHELLEGILANRPPSRLFDPCLGKGLLVRAAMAQGHSCAGIEFNGARAARRDDVGERRGA